MDIQDIARNTFTVSALLLTASIVLLNYFWKRLNTLIKTMPEGKRRVRFNLKSISDPVESEKYSYIGAQFLACMFITMSLVGVVFSISIMAGVMAGDSGGFHAADDFELAVVSMRAAVFFIFIALMSSGFVYIEDVYAIYTGQPSRTTTKLEDLPKPKSDSKARSNILAALMSVSFIVIALVDIFVHYNQWVKMTVATIALILLFIGVRLGYRAYVRIRSRRISAG